MAAIDDLIAQVEDKALRERLQSELDRLTREKKFGLVFEEHLPELTPDYNAKVQRGCLVSLRKGSLIKNWRVLSVTKGQALCVNPVNREKQKINIKDLVVVRRTPFSIRGMLVELLNIQKIDVKSRQLAGPLNLI